MGISSIEKSIMEKPASRVVTEYSDKLETFQSEIFNSQLRQYRMLAALAGLAILFAALFSMTLVTKAAPAIFLAVPCIGISWVIQQYGRSRRASAHFAQQCGFYERGIDRMTGNWRGKGIIGKEFARDNHLFQNDLNIIGDGSLFELLCTTRSEAGAERLACYLLDPAELEETKARQEAVLELRDATALREEIAVLGKYQFQECRAHTLRDWLGAPVLRVHRAIPAFLLVSSSVSLLFAFLCFVMLCSWIQLASLLISLLITQTSICCVLSSRIRPSLKTLEALTDDFVVLRQGLELMQRQSFRSAKLGMLVQRVCKESAASKIGKLERLLRAISQREKEWFYVPSLLLAVGTQLALRVERWRAQNRDDLKDWLDAWAEFEALSALACYAYEHPRDVFPEFADGVAVFEAKELGHPLLSEEGCIGNDIVFNDEARFYVISGSNMAGKSTFLRAIGVNAILASAGAPVRALSARISSFTVCASISIADSLLDGKSKFLTEVERLRDAISCTAGAKPVLFLIDEILSGTNSRDRRAAAECVVRALIGTRAVGALSTHDLILAEIAEIPGLRGANMHMESKNPDNPLDFDYLLKAGASRRSNALAIIRMMSILA